MSHYSYLIGSDGHFTKSIDMSCDNDDAAREKAKQLSMGTT